SSSVLIQAPTLLPGGFGGLISRVSPCHTRRAIYEPVRLCLHHHRSDSSEALLLALRERSANYLAIWLASAPRLGSPVSIRQLRLYFVTPQNTIYSGAPVL